MAAPPVVANSILEFRLNSHSGQQAAINVLHYWVSDLTPPVGLDDTILAFETLVGLLYKDCLCTQSTYDYTAVQTIEPLPRGQFWTSTALTGPGLGGVALLPRQVTGLIQKRTPLAGKQYQGRVYIPWPAEGDNNDATGTPTPAYVTRLQNLCDVLELDVAVAAGGSATLKPVIYHRGTPGTITLCHDFRPSPKWATQRRRGDYGRINVIGP